MSNLTPTAARTTLQDLQELLDMPTVRAVRGFKFRGVEGMSVPVLEFEIKVPSVRKDGKPGQPRYMTARLHADPALDERYTLNVSFKTGGESRTHFFKRGITDYQVNQKLRGLAAPEYLATATS